MTGRASHVLAAVCLLAGASLGGDVETHPAQADPAELDRLAADVRVVDDDGHPVEGLTAAQFEVTVDGRPHRVIAADFIDHRSLTADRPPRALVLAVGTAGLGPAEMRQAADATMALLRSVPDGTHVGLFAYPAGPHVAPTLDHQAVLDVLANLVGRDGAPPDSPFDLTPSALVDLSTLLPGIASTPEAERLRETLCPEDRDGSCEARLTGEVLGRVLLGEAHLRSEIEALETILDELATLPLRTTLVLVGGRTVVADIPFARPDSREATLTAGRLAAAARVDLYTLLARPPTTASPADGATAPSSPSASFRDERIGGLWLEQLAGAAGGAMLRLDDGVAAFERILRETSAYYRVVVETTPDDRPGRFAQLEVGVPNHQVGVRSRFWGVIPDRRGAALGLGGSSASPSSGISPDVQALADAFTRDDVADLARLLDSPAGANAVRALRDGAGPWEDEPHWQAAFALDIGLAGLRTASTFTQQAALQLLANQAVRVGRTAVDDPFACRWFEAAAAGLAGLATFDTAPALVRHAVGRCPSAARLHLALAVVEDQQLRATVPEPGTRSGEAPPLSEAAERVLQRFEAAADFPATHDEARVRAAWLLLRSDRARAAFDQLAAIPGPSADPVLRYLAALAAGEAFRRLAQPAQAQDALEAALDAWPTGQAAQVALMTLLVGRGDIERAVAIAEAVQTASPDARDPWWTYRLGDYRWYPALRARVHEGLP